jgi:hypothetical protein
MKRIKIVEQNSCKNPKTAVGQPKKWSAGVVGDEFFCFFFSAQRR